MKTIYLLLLFACANTAYGQDFCKLLKKEVSEDKKTFDYSSPFDPNEKPVVRVTRSYNNDPEYAYDNFYIVFRVEGALESVFNKTADGGQTEKREKAIVVEFEDKSKVTDDTIQINHDVSDDKLQAVRFLDYPLSEDNLKNFLTKKIVKFSLAGNEQAVTADSANAIMHYIQCMKTVK
jgi:hypothetical protein